MASSTPPHCSINATTTNNNNKPYQNHPYPPQNHHPQNRHHRWAAAKTSPSQKFSLGSSSSSSSSLPTTTTTTTTTPPRNASSNFSSPHHHLAPSKSSELGADFRGRRSTRFVSKMHFGRPKTVIDSRHSSVAEEALQQVIRLDDDNDGGDDERGGLECMLRGFESQLCGSDDYVFLLRELGNRGECSKAMSCFDFAVRRERKRNEQGKLASAMISSLGRLGRVDLAQSVFERAKFDGYGNTVYCFSALINAYGRNGYCKEAIRVLELMKQESGLKPNLVTYNAVIDACGKGGMDFFKQANQVLDEMLRNGVQPDRITYNSLLAVCSRGGLWEEAKTLFYEMVYKGIDRDIFTYNTLLDAVCKAGEMDLAFEIMGEMAEKKVWPNVVTYSTMVDGCAKAGKLDEALNLFNKMKFVGIGLDRISYNTLVAIYAKLGRFEEALGVCLEMESAGIKKDSVTYNALLVGYGKQGEFRQVQRLLKEMKSVKISPNILTYSTLMDVYSKGGMYQEAVGIFREFKQAGMKADVVLYSSLIDVFCKNGLAEFAVSLLDDMTNEGIRPNVVTYNSIIDAFGRSVSANFEEETDEGTSETHSKSSDIIALENVSNNKMENGEKNNRVMMIFGQLAAEKYRPVKEEKNGRSKEILCILELFHKMHELEIKPNVVTFSAILNACSRCNSFEDASMLLEELRLFDNQVYGVAYGLLMGCREEVWVQALTLFDEVKRMDSSTASAFYNALTDMLWHFGQVVELLEIESKPSLLQVCTRDVDVRLNTSLALCVIFQFTHCSRLTSMLSPNCFFKKRGAQLVMLEGKHRNVWENTWGDSCLDLHMMSSGAAQAMVHTWLLNIRSVVFEGHELPKLVSILTGWGKHSKVIGDGTLRRAVATLLTGIGAPFHVAKCNLGRFISTGTVVSGWLRESGTLKVLILHDDRTHPENARSDQHSDLQMLPS